MAFAHSSASPSKRSSWPVFVFGWKKFKYGRIRAPADLSATDQFVFHILAVFSSFLSIGETIEVVNIVSSFSVFFRFFPKKSSPPSGCQTFFPKRVPCAIPGGVRIFAAKKRSWCWFSTQEDFLFAFCCCSRKKQKANLIKLIFWVAFFLSIDFDKDNCFRNSN